MAVKRAWSRKNLWAALPPTLQRVVGGALRFVPPDRLLGDRFRAHLAQLEAAQWWSAEQNAEYQLAQLRRILTIADEKTEYYRRVFQEAGFEPGDLRSFDDLTALPLLDKHAIRENLRAMCAVDPETRGVDFVSTGGSSGVPLEFYIGADRSAVEYAHLVAGWQRVGFRLDLPQAVLRGEVVAPNRAGLRHRYDPLLRRHAYSNFHTSDADVQRYLAHIATLGPCFLHVYPSAVNTLIRCIERCGLSVPRNILGILAESENVYPADREHAERVFNCRYFSAYGHTEKLVLAAECEYSTDYHVWPTYGYCELLDDDGRPITTPGQRGEIVGTGFINAVMPFIRYRTGDYATYVGDGCEHCGRAHLVLRDIRGHRTQEHLVADDGSLIGWTALNMHDDTFTDVLRIQFSQCEIGRATLRVVPADGFNEQSIARIQRHLARKLEGRLKIEVEVCDEIPLTARGKAIYVDQKLDLDNLPTTAGAAR